MLRAMLLLAISLAADSHASVTIGGAIGRLDGVDWQLQQLSWQIVQSGAAADLSIRFAELQLAAPDLPPLTGVTIHCPDSELDTRSVVCRAGRLTATWGAQQLDGAVNFAIAGDRVTASLAVAALGGRIALDLAISDQLLVTAQFSDVALSAVQEMAPAGLPEGLTVAAGALLSGDIQWQPDQGVTAELGLTGLSFDSSDGLLAGAELALATRLNWRPDRRWKLALDLTDGELLIDPLYLSLGAQPTVSIEAEGAVAADGGVAIERFRISDPDALTIAGSGQLEAGGAIAVQAEIQQMLLPESYGRYLAPVLESFGAAGLEPSGQLLGQLQIRSGALQRVTVNLENFALTDARDRYGARNVSGLIDYDVQGNSLDSTLSWDRLRYYSLVIGSAESRFFTGGGEFSLLEGLFLPILDGGVQVDELAMSDVGQDSMTLDFRGNIRPMSLAQVTQGLGWPVMEGILSGEIPAVRLRQQVVEVGGKVSVDVFDGEVTIDNLRLERIFGVLPTLAADVVLDNIDLEQMTGAFSFGRIEGRLDGRVTGLRMLNWRPTKFDLDLHTPMDSKDRRRISQRAVDNLSSIGGGVAALSQTILRFFEDFSYRQLGIRCRLENDTCYMGGVSPAGNGYYLVEGAGIPRIDVKGFAGKVDWPQLLARLQAATRSGGATIQ